jgi:hypothetical protein
LLQLIEIYRLFRWKYLFLHECFPDREEVRIVDREHLNRDAADGRSAVEFGRAPLEMPTPLVLTWMEQADQFASGRIWSGNIRALVPVAVKAGQGKVLDGSWTTVLARNDVIDVKRQRINGNRQTTLLAPALRSLPDLADQVRVHGWGSFGGLRRRATLALDWMTASRFPTCR